MNERFFGEKSQQVILDKFTSFGIHVQSRYNDSSEIINLIECTKHLARVSFDKYVEEIFIDSQIGMPCITFKYSISEFIQELILYIINKYFCAEQATIKISNSLFSEDID